MDWSFIRGPRFMSYMALRMEATEKAIETMGREGRQRRLPNSSSMQVDETSLLHGKTSTPFNMRKPRSTIWIGDSVTPAMAFTSLALVSQRIGLLDRRTPAYRRVGRRGKRSKHKAARRIVVAPPKGDQARPLW